MLYHISFKKNNVSQSNFVDTEKDVSEIEKYFYEVNKVQSIYNIREAIPDDKKPGKPVIKL